MNNHEKEEKEKGCEKEMVDDRKVELDHHSNQQNPNNDAHQEAMDNRANQMNPNNPAYHSSRGRK